MTPEELQAKLLATLALQRELEALEDRFSLAIKELMSLKRESKKSLLVSFEGEIWRLDRLDLSEEAMKEARKHGGFYNQFRFRNLGKSL